MEGAGTARLRAKIIKMRGGFLAETSTEAVGRLRSWRTRSPGTDEQALTDLQQWAHRVAGTGSVLNCPGVARAASQLEAACRLGWHGVDSALEDICRALVDQSP